MAILPLIQAEGLLICLFTMCHELSSSWEDECWGHVCIMDEPKLPNWLIPVSSIFGAVIGCTCLLLLCGWCCRACRSGSASSLAGEPAVNLPTTPQAPPTSALPLAPSAPSLDQFGEPPPYSEVSWKPYYYPTPLGQPPAYDNIAMEGLPPVNASRPPESMPKDDF